MGWWTDGLRGRARDWELSALHGQGDACEPAPCVVEPDSAYLSIFLRSLRIAGRRHGPSRTYGTVISSCSLPHRRGERAEFFVVTTPTDLEGVSAESAHRVLTLNRRLLGPVPYRGGDVELQVGLFAVKGAELAGPFLELLETMASAAGIAFLGAAVALMQPLRRGLQLLLGSDDPSVLEVGLSLTLDRPTPGVYMLVGAPAGAVDVSSMRLDANSRLRCEDGRLFTEYPYLVFSVEAGPTRHDWFLVPGLQDAHSELAREVHKGDLRQVEAALAVFRRTAVMSDDLLAADGARLSEKVDDDVGAALQTRGTARRDVALRSLADVDLYE